MIDFSRCGTIIKKKKKNNSRDLNLPKERVLYPFDWGNVTGTRIALLKQKVLV